MAKQKWETDIFHYLSESHTPVEVRDVLYIVFHHWIYNKDFAEVDQYLETVSPELKEAVLAQKEIGWNHFFRGRFSVKWQEIIMRHLAREGTKTKLVKTSHTWASGLIIAIWHGVLILWDMRNRSLHGPLRHGQSAAEKRRLMKEVAWLLDIRDRHQQFNIEWFQKPIEELEKYSVISLKAWVRNARTMVRLHRLELQKTIVEEDKEEGDGLSGVNSVDLQDEMEEMKENSGSS